MNKKPKKVKVFGVFPAILVDDELVMTDHWLNSWWMGWYFYIYAWLSFHYMRKSGYEEEMFWAIEE